MIRLYCLSISSFFLVNFINFFNSERTLQKRINSPIKVNIPNQEIQKFKCFRVVQTSTTSKEKNSLTFIEGITVSIRKDMSINIKNFDFLSTIFGENKGFANFGSYDEANFTNPTFEEKYSSDGFFYSQYVGVIVMSTSTNVYSYPTRAIFIYENNYSKLIGIRLGIKSIYYYYTINF